MVATAAGTNSTILPPEDLESMLDLSRFLAEIKGLAALVGPDGQVVELPAEVCAVLSDVVASMRLGKAITVASVDQQLTTQEAADFLGISRPTLVKLLESGRIAFTQPGAGRHRRVRLADVVAYQEAAAAERRQSLTRITRESADAGLYDEFPDYANALRRARGKTDPPA